VNYNEIKYLRYGDRIHMQMKRLGASYDWDRVAFTMDPVSMFLKLFLFMFALIANCAVVVDDV